MAVGAETGNKPERLFFILFYFIFEFLFYFILFFILAPLASQHRLLIISSWISVFWFRGQRWHFQREKSTKWPPVHLFFNVYRQIDGIAPTFAQKPSIKQEEDGKRLRFECRVLADPRPDVSWFHDGNQVKNGGRHRVCPSVHLFSFWKK